MAHKQAEQPLVLDPAVRQYTVVCLLALLVVLVLLLEQGLGEWGLLVVVLGCVCVLLQVRFGPPLFLLALVWMTLAQARNLNPRRLTGFFMYGARALPPLEDTPGLSVAGLVLGVAVLVYSVGFYRLQSLTQHLFPVDPRRKRWARAVARRPSPAGREARRPDNPPLPAAERRPVTAVQSREIPLLVMSAGVWAVLAWLFWEWLAGQRPLVGFTFVAWRALLLFWLFGMGFLLTSGLLAYLSYALASVEASAVYLQDQLWQQTRREQSRINRWLMAVRLRWQRKEAK